MNYIVQRGMSERVRIQKQTGGQTDRGGMQMERENWRGWEIDRKC